MAELFKNIFERRKGNISMTLALVMRALYPFMVFVPAHNGRVRLEAVRARLEAVVASVSGAHGRGNRIEGKQFAPMCVHIGQFFYFFNCS